MTIPSQMQAVLLEKHIDDPVKVIESLKIVTRPVPKPGPGQVLIRIEASPCNPSDLMYLQGHYGIRKTPPTVPGFEAAGTVVASGGGFMGRMLVGKRVACGGQSDADGTWAEYFLADATFCIPLSKGVSTEQGAMMIVNPITAYALFDKCRREGHRAAVHTAGASQLGRMLIRLAAAESYPLINLVRREELRPELTRLGAKIVLNTTAPDFEQQLKARAAELGATIVLDAVAGELHKRVMDAMPDKTKAVVYGALSVDTNTPVDPRALIFRGQTVEGFWLSSWMASKGLLGKLRLSAAVQKLIESGTFGSEVRARLKLADIKSGLLDYQKHMSDGKVLICPGQP